MSLPWIRLDTALPDNPKILALVDGHKDGRASAFVYICAMTYAGRHGTDGFIPREALPRINGRMSDATRLCAVGLWKEAGTFGWEINGWAEYQASDESTQRRTERAKKAAAARWGNKP
jgi:hypothetical protein